MGNVIQYWYNKKKLCQQSILSILLVDKNI